MACLLSPPHPPWRHSTLPWNLRQCFGRSKTGVSVFFSFLFFARYLMKILYSQQTFICGKKNSLSWSCWWDNGPDNEAFGTKINVATSLERPLALDANKNGLRFAILPTMVKITCCFFAGEKPNPTLSTGETVLTPLSLVASVSPPSMGRIDLSSPSVWEARCTCWMSLEAVLIAYLHGGSALLHTHPLMSLTFDQKGLLWVGCQGGRVFVDEWCNADPPTH